MLLRIRKGFSADPVLFLYLNRDKKTSISNLINTVRYKVVGTKVFISRCSSDEIMANFTVKCCTPVVSCFTRIFFVFSNVFLSKNGELYKEMLSLGFVPSGEFYKEMLSLGVVPNGELYKEMLLYSVVVPSGELYNEMLYSGVVLSGEFCWRA